MADDCADRRQRKSSIPWGGNCGRPQRVVGGAVGFCARSLSLRSIADRARFMAMPGNSSSLALVCPFCRSGIGNGTGPRRRSARLRRLHLCASCVVGGTLCFLRAALGAFGQLPTGRALWPCRETRLHSPLYVLSADPELETVQARVVGRPDYEGYTIVHHAALGRHAEGLPRKRDMRFETARVFRIRHAAKDRGGGHADDAASQRMIGLNAGWRPRSRVPSPVPRRTRRSVDAVRRRCPWSRRGTSLRRC